MQVVQALAVQVVQVEEDSHTMLDLISARHAYHSDDGPVFKESLTQVCYYPCSPVDNLSNTHAGEYTTLTVSGVCTFTLWRAPVPSM